MYQLIHENSTYPILNEWLKFENVLGYNQGFSIILHKVINVVCSFILRQGKNRMNSIK